MSTGTFSPRQTPRHPIEHIDGGHYVALQIAQREKHFGLVIGLDASQNVQNHPNHVHRRTEPFLLEQHCLIRHDIFERQRGTRSLGYVTNQIAALPKLGVLTAYH